MEQNAVTTIGLPVALGIIMLGLGLSLTIDDFKRVVKYPKAVAIGLACQMLILPVACFALARAFALSPELSVGLMLLAASPGGATANLFSHLAKGDVALKFAGAGGDGAQTAALLVARAAIHEGFEVAYALGQDR